MISSQQLGERLVDARKRAKLTQAQVGDRMGVARTTIVAIEKGERRPSSVELVRLSEILGVAVHALLREGAVRSEVSPRFRMGPNARHAGAVQDAVERLRVFANRYVELERLNGVNRPRPPLENLATYRVEQEATDRLDPKLEGEDAARTVRSMLGLGDEPAVELDERFETEAGLRIFYLNNLPPKIAAFLIWSDELGACVAVNRAHPIERQRWSLAHELGHFLRDREAGDVLDVDDSLQQAGEIFPESFTKEFLLPVAGVRKRFTERCRSGKFTPVDLQALAKSFGVSFQAMALRLEELRLLPRGSYEKISLSGLRPQDLNGLKDVPQPPSLLRLGLPERYVSLAVQAYEQELLSETELAEAFATDVPTARAVYQHHRRISVGDGTELSFDLAGADLRIA